MGRMRSRIDIYRVQLRWKTWEAGLRCIIRLGVNRIIGVTKPPIHGKNMP
jgi:hypothetical protein